MKNIAVIGAGNIGRRHLQALSNLDSDYSLFVVDPVKEAIDLSKIMFDEVKKISSPRLESICDVKDLPSDLFASIIATDSEHRYDATIQLLEKNVRFIIFEKILFQDQDQYFEIEKRLNKKNIKSWVNCWRRVVPFYQELNKKNKNKRIISINVKGNKWELASGIIHFVDLISYLCGSTKYNISNYKVKIVPSKRSGFKELFGKINGSFNHQFGITTFSFLNNAKENSFEISIHYDDKIIRINDEDGWYVEEGLNEDKKETIRIPLQSQLTHKLINDIDKRGKCDLTTYKDSSLLHLPMIELFTNIFQNKGINGCPVT